MLADVLRRDDGPLRTLRKGDLRREFLRRKRSVRHRQMSVSEFRGEHALFHGVLRGLWSQLLRGRDERAPRDVHESVCSRPSSWRICRMASNEGSD